MDFLIPITSAAQMRIADAETIKNEPISSLDLMERAANRLFEHLKKHIDFQQEILIVCGPGNNGGDGLCIARLLWASGYKAKVWHVLFGKTASPENAKQAELAKKYRPNFFTEIGSILNLEIPSCDVILDCIFGTGLSQAITGEFEILIQKINNSHIPVISIDMPSGLFDTEPQRLATRIFPQKTFTIQAPKPSFFYPENEISFDTIDVGIQIKKSTPEFAFLSEESPYQSQILNSFPPKTEFGYKGTFGHALIIGGNVNMHGAIALATESCIAQGAGKTTVWAPAGARLYLAHIPKAMHIAKSIDERVLAGMDVSAFTIAAIGPGLNTNENSKNFLRAFLTKWSKPVILDADALNILAAEPSIMKLLPKGSLLTPHWGELTRLFGRFDDGKEMLEKVGQIASELGIYILAKNRYSILFCPNKNIFVNGSGSPKLAQGGSGDRLLGMVTGWWARTGDAELAAKAGMYIAGLD
ncbi:MAG: NAD(P)H-hydrate epimerase [Bacteroidia bacterium]|nr:NAD(P)H-hydrate epimerase [Bacteroidia bacterium]